jgi:biopolymer transport protein ExbD
MKNKPIWLVMLGVLAGILSTFLVVIAINRVSAANQRREAEATLREFRRDADDAKRLLGKITNDDAGNGAQPAPDEIKGATVVIDLKMEKDGLTLMAGDGTIMRQVPRQELAAFLKAMRKDGKTQVNLRAEGESPYKTVAEIVEEVQSAGFDKINLRTLPNK